MKNVAYKNSEEIFVNETWFRVTRVKVLAQSESFVTLEVALHCQSTGLYKVLQNTVYRVVMHCPEHDQSYKDLCAFYNHSIRAIATYAFR